MKRTKHSLSNHRLVTFDFGKLIPVGWYEALPGDTVRQASSALVRVTPLLAPLMHQVQVRIHHWFVPNRLIWANFENFITGGSDGEGDGSSWPYIDGSSGFSAKSLHDYFGLPVGVNVGNVSALPLRAYQLIYREFYRDQDLVTAPTISTADGADSTTSTTVQAIAYEKDYATAARPWPQKGPDVSLPLGTAATVKTASTALVTGAQNQVKFTLGTGSTPANNTAAFGNSDGSFGQTSTAATLNASAYPNNLYADLSDATSATITQLREAMALQRYQEARALYGSRFTEYLRYLGVRSSDSRLQRPEYLGGGKQTISFSEVLQTGTNYDGNTGVGQLKGHGITAMKSRSFQRFFEEHGIVMSLMSIRPRSMYAMGVTRHWTRDSKELYWQKELEAIGQQEVLNKEIYAAASAPTDVFGYADRYADYRSIPSLVTGEFRNSTMYHWHLARLFGSEPALNQAFIEADDVSKRVFADQTNDSFWVMVGHQIRARRLVGKRGVGGVR